MTGKYTLDDLVTDAGGADDSGSSGGDGGSGEWVMKLYDKLQSDGLVEALIFGPEAGAAPGSAPVEAATDGGASAAGPDLDSERVKGLLLQFYDNAGMIPGVSDDPTLSEVIKLVEKHPAVVDRLISQHMGGGGD